MYTITSPIHLEICNSKGCTKYTLNFNRTRNMHGFVWNRLKSDYKDLMLPRVQVLPKIAVCSIHYVLYVGSSHKTDVMNWIAVIDKFFQDVLVQAGKLEDDNYQFVPKISAEIGGIDKKNPRVEIFIKPE